MINRITDLSSNIPIWFIYGSKSWIDKEAGNIVKGYFHFRLYSNNNHFKFIFFKIENRNGIGFVSVKVF